MRRAAVLLAALALAGCNGGDDEAGPTARTTTTAATTAPPATTTTAERVLVRAYFVREERMGAAQRAVESTGAIATAAMRVLLDGPTEFERNVGGLQTQIPRGTRLLGLTIADGVATVDLSREFESGGGSVTMQLRVAQVVYTLTQFPSVRRVRFRIDGEPVDAIGGEGVVVSPPVGRGSFEDQTPPILVESPTPGVEVASPLRVTGTSNTFEATMFLRVVDASGRKLVDQLVTATSGSGTRGTFDATLRFDVDNDGPGTLVAYERSAEDGSETHVIRVPITLRRSR